MRLPLSERLHIVRSASALRGNGKVAVIFEPLFGIPFVLFNFYMSLYMKSLGVTNPQLGYIAGIGSIASAAISLLAGPAINRLGRRRSTLVFDLCSWIPAILIWLFSHDFWMFAVAAIFTSGTSVVTISYTCLIVEDSTDEERLSVFNFNYILNLAVGVITPAAGLIIGHYGIQRGERLLLVAAAVSITVMDLARNHFFRETATGLAMMKERRAGKRGGVADLLKIGADLRRNRPFLLALSVSILFNVSLIVSPFGSVYFAPYLTEIVGLNRSAASFFGSIVSFVMIIVFVFVVPALIRGNKYLNLIVGLAVEVVAFAGFLLVPPGGFRTAALFTVVFAAGNSLCRPFLDAVMASATEGHDRAGYYAFCGTAVGLANAAAALGAGHLYNAMPALLCVIPMLSLFAAGLALIALHRSADSVKVEKGARR